jgi:hypothetical protein
MMDRKFRPVIRKILIDKIHIPFYMNSTVVFVEFIKKLWKFRCILENLYEKFMDVSMDRLYYDNANMFDTFPTPNKKSK